MERQRGKEGDRQSETDTKQITAKSEKLTEK